MKSKIIVYSKPKCVQCNSTYKALDKHNIDYDVIDVTEDEEALTFIKGLGYQQAPVVFIDDNTHWSGFRLDRIKELT